VNRTLTAVISFFVFTSFAALSAEGSFTLAPWGGYTSLNMTEVQKNIFNTAVSNGTIDRINQFSPSNNMIGGMDFGLFRFSYLMPTSAQVTWTDISLMQKSDQVTTQLSAGMAGFRVPHPTRSLMCLGVFLGYGMVSVIETLKNDIGGPGEAQASILAAGTGPVAEVTCGLQIWRLEVNISYRYAPVSKVAVTAVSDPGNIIPSIKGAALAAGDALKDTAGKDLVFDNGGVSVTVGLRFGSGPVSKEEMQKQLQKDLQKQLFGGYPAYWYGALQTYGSE
jgi:hypothetical protein